MQINHPPGERLDNRAQKVGCCFGIDCANVKSLLKAAHRTVTELFLYTYSNTISIIIRSRER